MEDHILSLLKDTLKSDTIAIRNAEQSLNSLYPDPQFPLALLNIASHTDVDVSSRQSSLTTLKNYVSATWSPQFDETFQGSVYLNDEAKSKVRDQVFEISVTPAGSGSSDLQGLAASVVGKIASADFPDEWPNLMQSLLNLVNTSSDNAALRGALKTLAELIDAGLAEDQFFAAARDLVSAFQHVSTNNTLELNTRALSLNVLQTSFDTLEMVMKAHEKDVKSFLDECLKTWMTFFLTVLQEPLPAPSQSQTANDPRRGLITFKIQVVMTIEKLRNLYPSGIASYVTNLFQTLWQELSRLAPEYGSLFIDGETEARLVGESDNLPYSLDLLIVELIDLLQAVLRAPTVRSEFTQQIKQQGASENGFDWIQELLAVLVQYSRASEEEQGMWDADINIYLAEMDAITANYTPRAACAEIISRTLYDWLKQTLVEAMLFFDKHRNSNGNPVSSKDREAFLYLLNQGLKEFDSNIVELEESLASRVMEQVSGSLQHSSPYVRAGAQFVLGTLFKITGDKFHDAGASAFANAVQSITSDDSDIVKVACLNVLPHYMDSLPKRITRPMQNNVFDAVAHFIAEHDLKDELEESDDVKGALITALRDAMLLDTSKVIATSAIDTLLTLASDGATSFLLASQVSESFEGIAAAMSELGTDKYAKLCSKTIPALSGAFDVGDMTSESALTNLAAELMSKLAEFGTDPLPDGFVAAVMPKLQRVLMHATDDALVQPATTAVTFALKKGTAQFMSWKDQTGTGSLEVVLTIINRLLNAPEVDEQAAQEVGGLASVVVEKYGSAQLGPYLPDLLQALATRLAPAQQIQFIQSLLMVFVGLTISAPKDVVDFLYQLTINNQNGLTVVLTKWLDNSILFAGFDEVRQNTVALSKLFALQDDRIKQIGVKGDLIIENTGRIKTRSQAKLNPDRYSTIGADVKILKLLVEELSAAAQSRFSNLSEAQAAAMGDDDAKSDDSGDGEWEDEPDALDLGSGLVKEELMRFGEEGSPTGSRARDEETAEYLGRWFREEGGKEAFGVAFGGLSEEERGKLRALVG